MNMLKNWTQREVPCGHRWAQIWSNADWRPATRWLFRCTQCREMGYGVPA
jgi:hypothetical protein